MKVEWMNHTGFVVSDMERSLDFYRDLLGLQEERNHILEGEFISQLVGYPNAKLHIVYLDARAFSFSCLVGKAHHVESFAEMGIVAA